jgi:acetyl-CoA carboxylase biotin carboxyl carrier protein
MTVKELREMISLMQENGLVELEIEKNGFKIRLKKGAAGAIVPEMGHAASPVLTQPGVAPQVSPLPAEQREAGMYFVRSPMVGTFYASPAPDAQPYVVQGKDMKEGDILCIIEAMKLMNEIKSEVHGRVVEILVKNGQSVEFDQPLFKIKTS